jgi:hypothetical protein
VKRTGFGSETELARVLVGWLKLEGWDVYQEVHMKGATCDVVATRGPLIWAIETKLQFGCSVLEQAAGWLTRANLVSVATPPSRPSHVLTEYARDRGIGWLQITSRVQDWPGLEPALHRVCDRAQGLREWLRPQQQSGVPAGSQGGYFTPFKDTCEKVAAKVRERPGLTLKELLTDLGRMHYASAPTARSSIAYWARKGQIAGVELRQEGRRLRLYPLADGEEAGVVARRNRLARVPRPESHAVGDNGEHPSWCDLCLWNRDRGLPIDAEASA